MKYTGIKEASIWCGKFLIRTLIIILFFEEKFRHTNPVLPGDLACKITACFIQSSYHNQWIN